MAFLRAGADALVYDALEFAGGRSTRAGESLQDVLGSRPPRSLPAGRAADLLGGPARRQALSLVQDEVRAELTGYLRSARQEILFDRAAHAELERRASRRPRATRSSRPRSCGASDRGQAVAARAADASTQADEPG